MEHINIVIELMGYLFLDLFQWILLSLDSPYFSVCYPLDGFLPSLTSLIASHQLYGMFYPINFRVMPSKPVVPKKDWLSEYC